MINYTKEQSIAIEYPSSMVLTACPGSGKTAVIVSKIVNDLALCNDYQGVIAISYTNKASDELKKRCLKVISDPKSSFFGTIDKFYLTEIIYQYIKHIWGYADKIKIIKFNELDDATKDKLVKYSMS